MGTIDTNLQPVANETPVNQTETPETTEENTGLPAPVKFSKTQIIILVVGIVLIVVAFISFLLEKPKLPTVTIPSPLLVATQSASLPPKEISEFGKTEAFTNFENKLTDLQKTNSTVDLYEAKLSFPLLDMNVNFNK